MTTYTVALAKGGSTKTTTAAELVAALAAGGRRVLALDLDQQGNLTTRLGVPRSAEAVAVAADVLTGDATAQTAALPSPSVPGADVIAGTQHLADVEHLPEIAVTLRDYLPTLADRWDDVVIDTPPALGLVTLAALAAADVTVAPVACETEAYEQLERLTRFIEQRVNRRLRPGQRVHWVVPTRYDPRRLLDREVVEMLTEKHSHQVTTTVREGVVARDAYTAGQPVSVYAPTSGVARDYRAALAPIVAEVPSIRLDGQPVPSAAN